MAGDLRLRPGSDRGAPRLVARVELVIEDGDTEGGTDRPGVTVWLRSQDPPIPLKNGDLDVDAATPAQSAARLMLEELMGTAGARQVLAVDEDKAV